MYTAWFFHLSTRHCLAQSHTLFTHFSHTFGYFRQIWANFNVLGIKKHVVNLESSLMILSQTFTHYFTHSHTLFTHFSHSLGYFHLIGTNFSMLHIKKHVLFLESSLVILSHTSTHSFKHSHTLFTYFSHTLGYFHQIWDSFNMLGIKSMYLSQESHWWYFHELSDTSSHTLHILFTKFWLFSSVLSQF